jgi:putative ABC transport system ATP-binding protein
MLAELERAPVRAIVPRHAVIEPRREPSLPIVSMLGLHKSYRQGHSVVPALNGVDLHIEAGEMLAICGPSGSGKSTLLNIIGLLDEPDAGEMEINGRRLSDLSSRAKAELRSSTIGFIFQSFNLIPVLTAHENVLLPLRLQGKTSSADEGRAESLLCTVGLKDQIRTYPDRMSGGQRQRVAIARALMTRPRLLIADEPTANLDTENSLMVMELLAELRSAQRLTCVFSTHDHRILKHMSRIVSLRDGRITLGDL